MALTRFEKPLEEYNRDDIRKIAGLYGIKLSTIITQKLNKSDVIELIKNTEKYKKESQKKEVQQRSRNRISPLVDDLIGIEEADDIMVELLGVLQESGKVPSAGRFYIFVYNAKTPGIRYDQNPLVAVTDVFSWGFRGLNFHWGEVRQYTWAEVAGSLYEVYQEEIEDLRRLPFANIQTK